MSILTAGILFWIFCLVVVARLVGLGTPAPRVGRGAWLAMGALLVAAMAMLLRPHEDVFGGQDGGAYLTIGARLAREPRLVWQDELLAEVPPETRPAFLYYGPGRPYLSKYACGRVRDLDRAEMSVWFQPAFPVVLAAVARLSPAWVFYVVPLFALFTALALRALAAFLCPHRWAGTLAFAFYLFNPLVNWHARHPRPEFLAAFLLFGGAALLLQAAYAPARGLRRLDILLGSLAIALAPFFHITACLLVIPAAGLVLALMLAGRREFLVFPAVGFGAAYALARQTLEVADPYSLRRFIEPAAPWLLHRPGTLAAAAVAVLAGSWLISRYLGRFRRGRSRGPTFGDSPSAGLLMAAAVAAAFGACYIAAVRSPPSAENPFMQYVYRTDLPSVVAMLSRPIAWAGLLGLVLFAARADDRRRGRWALLLFAVPAALGIGNLYDFFMTRYTMVALMPLLALGLTGLATALPDRTPAFRRVTAVAAVALVLVGLRGRTAWVAVEEYRGLTEALSGVAKTVRAENGLLLAEYPRLAAPLDLLFGVPTLALHPERDGDTTDTAAAWAEIMRKHPARPAFFLTPFQPPVSDLFVFEPLSTRAYEGSRLVGRRWDRPTEAGAWSVTLRLYRMTLRGALDSPADAFPFAQTFDIGNMGLRRFANVQEKPREVSGCLIDPERPLTLTAPEAFREAPPGEWLVLLVGAPPGLELTLWQGEQQTQARPRPLVADWSYARVPVAAADVAGEPLRLEANAACFIGEVIGLRPGVAASYLREVPASLRTTRTLAPLLTRWARDRAAFCAPVPAKGGGLLALFHNACGEPGGEAELRLQSGDGPVVARRMPTEVWGWSVWFLDELEPAPGAAWFKITTPAPFNLNVAGFPEDSATHAAFITVME